MPQPTIPRKLHFIWVGGPMPDRNKQCLRSFRNLAMGYEKNLWIDRNNLLAGTRRGAVMGMFKGADGKLTGDWRDGPSLAQGDAATIKNQIGGTSRELTGKRQDAFDSLSEFARQNGFRLRFVSELGNGGEYGAQMMKAQYNREMLERGTNFGAASDILRILILIREGGVYLDTDVTCTTRMPYIGCPTKGALWGYVAPPNGPPSRAEWDSEDWWIANFDADRPKICNSTIACHANSDAIRAYQKIVLRNYNNIFTDDQKMTYYYRMAGIRMNTIRTTGPSAATEAGGIKTVENIIAAQTKHRTSAMKQRWRENRTQFNNRVLDARGEEHGRMWFKAKDDMIFPPYLIRDQFFHDWL